MGLRKIKERLKWDVECSSGVIGTFDMCARFETNASNQDTTAPHPVVITEIVISSAYEEVASYEIEPQARFAGGYALTDSLSLDGNLNFARRRDESGEERSFESAGSTVLRARFAS